jgi:hypothetical protein
MKTYDNTDRNSVKLWVKQARGDNDSTGPYTLLRFEMNCKGSQIRTLALAKYNESGELVGSREGGRWESIVPDTLGEALNNAVCAVVP